MRLRNTYLLVHPGLSAEHRHLYVVVHEDKEGGCLIFNFTTYDENRRGFDPACVVEANEHPWLKHRSYVVYQHGEYLYPEKAKELDKNTGVWKKDRPVSQALHKKIVEGAIQSRFTRRDWKRLLQGDEEK